MKLNIHIECETPEEVAEVFARLSGDVKTPAKKKTATKKAAAKKAAKDKTPPAEEEDTGLEGLEEEEEETAASEHTVESLTALGKELAELSGDTKTLRLALNEAGIKGKTISNCDSKFYDAIHEKLTEAIAKASEV